MGVAGYRTGAGWLGQCEGKREHLRRSQFSLKNPAVGEGCAKALRGQLLPV